MAKAEYLQIRVDAELKNALEEFCEKNFIDRSSAARMMIAQYPAIKEILEKQRLTKSPK